MARGCWPMTITEFCAMCGLPHHDCRCVSALPMTPPNAPTAGASPLTADNRLELRHVEHLMDVCGDSHDALMLLGTMAVIATVIRQRDEAESALSSARE